MNRCSSTGVLDHHFGPSCKKNISMMNGGAAALEELLKEYDITERGAQSSDDDDSDYCYQDSFSALYTVSERDLLDHDGSSSTDDDDDDDDSLDSEDTNGYSSSAYDSSCVFLQEADKKYQPQKVQRRKGSNTYQFVCPVQEVTIPSSPMKRKKKKTTISSNAMKAAATALQQQQDQQGHGCVNASTRSLLLRKTISARDFVSFGKGTIIQSEPATTTTTSPSKQSNNGIRCSGPNKPQDEFVSLLRKHGYENVRFVRNESVPPNFFVRVTSGMMAAYDASLASAVRRGDLDAVRGLHQFHDRELQACNKFSESVVHVCARRGFTDVLSYLLDYAGVRVQVCCDSGRNPLHDACWTSSGGSGSGSGPNFECVKLLLAACPDLLLIQDNRGFCPLAYVSREAWPQWNAFLLENSHLILPKVLASRTTH